jgi:hypothetical protein
MITQSELQVLRTRAVQVGAQAPLAPAYGVGQFPVGFVRWDLAIDPDGTQVSLLGAEGRISKLLSNAGKTGANPTAGIIIYALSGSVVLTASQVTGGEVASGWSVENASRLLEGLVLQHKPNGMQSTAEFPLGEFLSPLVTRLDGSVSAVLDTTVKTPSITSLGQSGARLQAPLSGFVPVDMQRDVFTVGFDSDLSALEPAAGATVRVLLRAHFVLVPQDSISPPDACGNGSGLWDDVWASLTPQQRAMMRAAAVNYTTTRGT